MKHSSRRILALLLALSLCIGMMPMSIFADEGTESEVIEQSAGEVPVFDANTEDGTDILEEETKEEPAAPAEGTTVLVDGQDEPADQPAEDPIEQPSEEAAVEKTSNDDVVIEFAAEKKAVEESDGMLIKAATLGENNEEDNNVIDMALKAVMITASRDYNNFVRFHYGDGESDMISGSIYPTQVPNVTAPVGVVTPPKFPDKFIGKCDERIANNDKIVGWKYYGRRVPDFETETFSYTSVGSITHDFYAIWKPGDESDWVKVTFDAGFADCYSPVDQEMKIGEKAVDPITDYYDPKHKGFAATRKWVDKKDLPEGFDYSTDWALVKDLPDFSFKTAIKEDTDLILRWEKEWTVTFNFNNGEGSKSFRETAMDGKPVEKPEDPQVLNHHFLGWYVNTSQDGQEPNYVEYDFTQPVTSDLALYAQWEEACVVKYYAQYPMRHLVQKDAKLFDEVTYVASSEEFKNKEFAAAQYSDFDFQSEDTFPGWRFVGWIVSDKDPSVQPGSGGGNNETYRRVDHRHSDLKQRKVSNEDLAKSLVKQADEPPVVKPGDPVTLHTTVYMSAVWEPYPAVVYLPDYPFDVVKKVKDPEAFYPVEGDALGEDLTKYAVLPFSKTGLEAAPGYEFIGWDMEQIPFGQALGPNDPGNSGGVKKLRQVVDQEKLYTDTDKVDISEYHYTIFHAHWNRRPTVTYHTAYEDLNPAPKMEEKEYLDPTPYSWPETDEDKENFKFKVLPVSATGFKAPEGYVFSHWRLTWTELDSGRIPSSIIDRPIAEIEQREENYRDEAKKLRLSDMPRSAEVKVPAEAAEAVTIIPVADKVELTGEDPGPFVSGDIYPLHRYVDLFAVWVPGKLVQYNTNYPTDTPNFVADDWIGKADETYTVKSFEEVQKLNKEFVAPEGYAFAGWVKDERTPSESNPKLDPGAKVDLPKPADENGNGDGNTPRARLVATDKVTGTPEAAKEKVLITETREEKLDFLTEKDKIEQQEDEVPTPAQKVPDPEVIFYAQWVKAYTVTWVDEDKTELEKDTNVPEGTTPTYNSETPTKPEDDNYTYTFAGWTPEISPVKGDVTYTAQYTATPKTPNTPNTPHRPNTPNDPAPVTPAEEVSEIENNETPLTGYEESAEEVNNNETPLAGFEVEPEEETEVAEEAIPLTPLTGDDRHTAVWGAVSVLALLGIVLVVRRRKEE